jgi:DNA-binding NarL/FixJ family response regulator
MAVRILLADDHKIVRDGLRSLLEKQQGMEVVGEAENGRRALELAQQKKPDVVIMDVSMPDLNGIEATRIINSKFSDTKVIILTLNSDQTVSGTALQAGACQFLNKYCGQERLYRSIKECSPAPLRVVGNPPH